MTNPDAEFWNLVGERVDPSIFEVGDALRIESPHYHRIVEISDIEERDNGKRSLTLRNLSAVEVLLAQVKATVVVNSDPSRIVWDDNA